MVGSLSLFGPGFRIKKTIIRSCLLITPALFDGVNLHHEVPGTLSKVASSFVITAIATVCALFSFLLLSSLFVFQYPPLVYFQDNIAIVDHIVI